MTELDLDFFPEILNFLNSHKEPFLMSELATFLNLENNDTTCEQLIDLLVGEALAYFIPNEEEEELWISRQAFFTNKTFSIQISEYELKNKIFIQGSRFLPFTNIDNNFQATKILYNGKEIEKTATFMPFERVTSFYFLSTENNISHTLCEESEKNIEIFSQSEDDYSYNANFEVQAWNFEEIYENIYKTQKDKYQNNEKTIKLFVKIVDWHQGIFEILNQKVPEPSNQQVEDWFNAFESGVRTSLKILNVYATTYEIISFAFFIYSELLFTKKPIPMELFFENKDIFSIKPYGIEEKFWISDEEIPVPEKWMSYPMDINDPIEGFFINKNTPITNRSLHHLITDYLRENYATRFDKEVKENFTKELAELSFSKISEIEKENIEKIINYAYDDMAESYNPFTDQVLKEVREDLIIFYKDILKQYTKINKYKLQTQDLEHQSALVLNQITLKVLQAFDFISSIEEVDYEYLPILSLSMENLAYVFADMKVEITNKITDISKT